MSSINFDEFLYGLLELDLKKILDDKISPKLFFIILDLKIHFKQGNIEQKYLWDTMIEGVSNLFPDLSKQEQLTKANSLFKRVTAFDYKGL